MLLFFLRCSACCSACPSAVTEDRSALADSLAGSRPNIILVMTDDQGMGDLSCLGNEVLQTPNLDRFYGMSTRFTDFHVSPTCAPTRSAIFSGRHEFRNGVTHTIKERERMALSHDDVSATAAARPATQTGIFGKWHLGDEDEYQPYNRGFSEVFIHGAGGIGQSYEGSCADFPPNRRTRHVLRQRDLAQRHDRADQGLLHGRLLSGGTRLDQATARCRRRRSSPTSRTNAPHGPMIAPEKYKKRFARSRLGREHRRAATA